jgi:hypothetical protein
MGWIPACAGMTGLGSWVGCLAGVDGVDSRVRGNDEAGGLGLLDCQPLLAAGGKDVVEQVLL